MKAFLPVVFVAVLVASGCTTVTDLHCDASPTNPECFCDEGEKRIYVPFTGIDKWACENVELLLLDPDSETFEQDAVDFALNQFDNYCGNICTDLSCGEICSESNPTACQSDRFMFATFGYSSSGDRLVFIQCIDNVNEVNEWSMNFLVESPTDTIAIWDVMIGKNYCVNSDATILCTTQQHCDARGNPQNCFGNIPAIVMDVQSSPASFFNQIFYPRLGSGYPSPIDAT